MLNYHKNGVTLTLELPSGDEVQELQAGLTDALQLIAAADDAGQGAVIQLLARLLAATHLTDGQQRHVAAVLQRVKAAA